MLSFPKMSRYQKLMASGHAWRPSGLHLSLSGSSCPLCLVCAMLGNTRNTFQSPPHYRLWESLLGTQEPSAAPGNSVRPIGPICLGAHWTTSISTLLPIMLHEGSTHLLGSTKSPRPLPTWISRPNWGIHPPFSLPYDSSPSPTHGLFL